MKEKKSFIRIFLKYLIIMTGLILAIIGIFLISTFAVLENEIKESSNAFLTIYSNELSNSINGLDGILKSVASQKVDLAKIKSSEEKERSLSAISLSNYLKELFSNRDWADAVIIYDKNYDICLDRVNSSVSYMEKRVLREAAINALESDKIESGIWNFINLGDQIYLYKVLKTKEQVLCVYVQAKNLLTALKAEENGKRSLVLVNKEGIIGKIWGVETKDIKTGLDIKIIKVENYYQIKKEIVSEQLYIYCFKEKSDFLNQIQSSTIIVAIVAGTAFGFMLFILLYTKKELVLPMQIMVKDMARIKEGEYHNRIDDSFNTREFQMLKDATNQMIEEIVGLKIQGYEKLIELQDMELRSIRLQLKPHFFLNALTTISSLSNQNKNEQIREYIDALSKNIRYMFHTGFHTVTIKEEIRHVVNYFEMQELKYPNFIFYLIDLPKELVDWSIPQMLIHTFVENEYKYAVSIDNTLTVLIKISKQIFKNQEMLLIEIEDDGEGYPKEVLDYMNETTKYINENGTRVGLWSIKNMMKLMYDRNDLVILKNVTPHGCLNQIYVPRQAKHELKKRLP